jgi:hypothetical protein
MVARASCALLVALVAVCSVQTGAPPPGTSAVSSAPVHPPAHLQNQHRGHPGCWRRSKRWFDSAHGGMIHAIPYPAVGVQKTPRFEIGGIGLAGGAPCLFFTRDAALAAVV